jgi:Ser-tRNA(Ala) deacylase AlaX
MDLLVTYPAGSTAESTVVAAATRTADGLLFAVERTPCHPESPRWPDQPRDRCTLKVIEADRAGAPTGPPTEVPVECYEGYLLSGELELEDPPSHLGDPPPSPSPPPRTPHPLESRDLGESLDLGAWDPLAGDLSEDEADRAIRCVVHRVPGNPRIAVGDKVSLRVDERYREAVSRSHSRCHLVSLALNAALAGAWRKDPGARDSLGRPDFDKLAIVSSKIDEDGSLDSYRVGKHLRKAGFSVEALSDANALRREVMRIARGWLQSRPEMSVTPGRCRLEERRTWLCALPQGTASFPCGGTHIRRMEPDEGLAVAISWDPQERCLAMRAAGGPLDV